MGQTLTKKTAHDGVEKKAASQVQEQVEQMVACGAFAPQRTVEEEGQLQRRTDHSAQVGDKRCRIPKA
jgi:hypothetical protein